jgi:soluble lytic murein transglycosylase-like protein
MDKSPISFQSSTIDPQNPQSIALARALMKAQYDQAMGQSLMDEGSQDPGATQFVPGNQWGPAVAIRRSPFEAMGRAAEKMTGAYMSKNSMEQMLAAQLQQAQVKDAGLQSGLAGLAGGGAAPAPQQLAAGLGASTPAPTGAGGMPLPQQLGAAMGTPKGLDYAQMMAESGGDPNARSPKGAAGRWQIMPATWADPGFGIAPGRGATRRLANGMWDPASAPQEEQDRLHSDYMAMLQKRYGGDERLALAGYNAGPGMVDKVKAGLANMPVETTNYYQKILASQPQEQGAQQAFGGMGGDTSNGYQPPSQPPAAPPQAAPSAPPQQPAQSSNFTPEMGQFAAKLQHLVTYNGLSPDLAKAYWERAYPGMTPTQLDAQASGIASPLDYEAQKAGKIAQAGVNPAIQQKLAEAQIAQGQNPLAGGSPMAAAPQGQPQAPLKTPAQLEREKSMATTVGTTMGDEAKTLNVMQSNLPAVMKQFAIMRENAPDASYGLTTGSEGGGLAPMLANSGIPFLGDKTTSEANAKLKQQSSMGILRELGPQLAQAGVKGNKFLETIANNASAIDMSAPPQTKLDLIDGLQSQYINNLKATASQLRANGQPAPTDAEIDAMVAQNAPPQKPPTGGNVPKGWKVEKVIP